MDDKKLRRAGLDYNEWADVTLHEDWSAFLQWHQQKNPHSDPLSNLYACTTKGARRYTDVVYQPGDTLLFGPETRGLPNEILTTMPPTQKVKLPMLPNSRSLNLSNAVSIFTYEAWRQLSFSGATPLSE